MSSSESLVKSANEEEANAGGSGRQLPRDRLEYILEWLLTRKQHGC